MWYFKKWYFTVQIKGQFEKIKFSVHTILNKNTVIWQQMLNKLSTIGIVLPCCNEEEILLQTDMKISALVESLIQKKIIGEPSLILYVDDGSTDNTWNLIQSIVDNTENKIGVKLSRNFGHQSALIGGITSVYQQVDCVITIDADLQDDISVIEEMVVKYAEGYDIVYGARGKRDSDNYFKRKTALAFYSIMKKLGVNIIYNHADFRLASRRVCENLFKFREVNLFLRGIFPLIGFKNTVVYYDRLERTSGKTKYPFLKMLGFALNGITSFSIMPLRIVTLTGIFIFFTSIILSFYSLYSFFFLRAVPGWTSITLPIYFIAGIQILCIGIIGEYLGKIYEEVKSRPKFIIETIIQKIRK